LLGILCGSVDIVLICFPVREEKKRRGEEKRITAEEESQGGCNHDSVCVCVCVRERERERERYDNRKQLKRQKRTAATTSCIYVWRTCGKKNLSN
jgi:hypothetical protein